MEVLNDEARERAEKRVSEIKAFYTHVSTYIIVNIFLFLLNWITAPGNWWFYWPLLGWGVGLASHGMNTFNWNPFLKDGWEERKIEELMEKDRKRKE